MEAVWTAHPLRRCFRFDHPRCGGKSDEGSRRRLVEKPFRAQFIERYRRNFGDTPELENLFG